MTTSVFIAAQLLGVFNQLKAHNSLKLKFSVFLNSSEVGNSQATVKAAITAGQYGELLNADCQLLC